MNRQAVLTDYSALHITVPTPLMAWMRSNHAGETGAVWIYVAASLAFWSVSIREMATQHIQTEQHHLLVMTHVVPADQQSKLLLIWKIMGFTLGLFAALFGYTFFCLTINAVESFVEQHYNEQIDHLIKTQQSPSLLALIQRCCAEETQHKSDAESHFKSSSDSVSIRAWLKLVKVGSSAAVEAAKKI